MPLNPRSHEQNELRRLLRTAIHLLHGGKGCDECIAFRELLECEDDCVFSGHCRWERMNDVVEASRAADFKVTAPMRPEQLAALKAELDKALATARPRTPVIALDLAAGPDRTVVSVKGWCACGAEYFIADASRGVGCCKACGAELRGSSTTNGED